MSAQHNVEIPQRLEEMETAVKSRLLESTLRPLARADDPSAANETVAVPVELLLIRFKNLDRGISDLRKRLDHHEEALQKRIVGEWIRAGVLVVVTAALTTGLPKAFAHTKTAEKAPETVLER